MIFVKSRFLRVSRELRGNRVSVRPVSQQRRRPAGTPPPGGSFEPLTYGQVNSRENGLFTGVIGLAMSTPTALPVIL